MTLLNLQEASRQLRVSPHTLRHWAQQGKFPYVRTGKLLRFRQQDLEKFVRDNLVEAKGSSK